VSYVLKSAVVGKACFVDVVSSHHPPVQGEACFSAKSQK
jgi:hypothetical protein